MRKTHLVAVLSFAALACAASAQEGAAPKADKTQRIATINMERVSTESLLGKGYAKKLEDLKNEIDAEGQKKQADLNKLDTAIKAMQDDLEKTGSVLSPEGADKKRQDIVKKQRERQAFLEDGQAELQRMRDRAQQQAQALENEFQVKIRPHIEAVVKDKNIDILLDNRVVLVAAKESDITSDVVLKSNEAERLAKPAASPAPAPASPKPAAPAAAPTPAPEKKP
jgi:Skp family chaperone for outer membrane proteins